MGKNIILTESQFRGYIQYLKEQQEMGLLKEDIVPEQPKLLYMAKQFLDKNYEKTTRPGRDANGLNTRKMRCAIAKCDLDSKEPEILYDQQLKWSLEREMKGAFESKEVRDRTLSEWIDAWFKNKINILGPNCATLVP